MHVHSRALTRRRRVIISTDAKNEADDQFTIVHGLLSPSLDVRAIIPARFGQRPGRSLQSMQDSRAEVELILNLMDLEGAVRLANGAPHRLPDAQTPVPSAGDELIIEEAMRQNAGGLCVAFLGPLTDMASLLMEPGIAQQDVTVVWIGGGPYDDQEPPYWPEFNLSNDVTAANVADSSRARSSEMTYRTRFSKTRPTSVQDGTHEARPTIRPT